MPRRFRYVNASQSMELNGATIVVHGFLCSRLERARRFSEESC